MKILRVRFLRFSRKKNHETAWCNLNKSNELQDEIKTNKDSAIVDPYANQIHIKGKYFDVMKTVAHIPREIYRHVYF